MDPSLGNRNESGFSEAFKKEVIKAKNLFLDFKGTVNKFEEELEIKAAKYLAN